MDSLKLEIKRLLIETLDLEDMTPADIDDDAPLFDTNGIGLDSIDALEIGIALRKQYQLTIAADDQRTREHFRSVNTLAELIQSHQSHQ
ncbi:acyl carrier protein [Ralstonia solanacearum]|uniref:Phosphopantetheine-binding protein n=2 Tax=Ralstonia solanacearum TaxID=305 RepID=A0AAW5ZTE0_RALSL|nr:phosphopantetheine-binding protein [Ralstonia solanacearum]MBT1539441.1 acyl carrier protein [Ralstonia solanacearum]MDB0512558.1 phosphopantetheine-binding protein [Ralstonia solanacearum]MDB0526974.1 phosphopantetheine-binding protein [Ralstonia solanacearum]MDB0572668.1 phosphopantetheine-binding protein [Ralstonia solanacearum]OAI62438.1 acyl carrier protein [Ralstonia solanacearum]